MWQACRMILRGLGERGVGAAAAVFDGRVVAVDGGGAAGVGLAGLIDASAQPGGACRDRYPGGCLLSEEDTVMSRPVNRTALRDEENPPAPPS